MMRHDVVLKPHELNELHIFSQKQRLAQQVDMTLRTSFASSLGERKS